MSIRVFGIRHHGPGSARSLLAALEGMRPDAVLVEGPPDAEDVLPLLARPEMKPPVALLVYPPDAPQNAAYYPFAAFSPEWQALRYAHASGAKARFIDLPRSLDLGGEEDEESEVREDPIGLLANAAGYEDRELWWERQVEQRRDARDLFDAILEAMSVLREGYESPPREARREANMRREIRKARREGHENVAVVCGAWHAPALRLEGYRAKSDDALLKGLKRRKTAATWIPWTNGRLSYRSGYGAGIASPGYYEHLWTSDGAVATRWLSHVARLLRSEDLDASPANVVEAARLAETLAALRDLPAPGLHELREAALATLCAGETEKLTLIRDKLETGEKLGEVPAETPTVPLKRDLERLQKRLRLQASAEERHLDLDLREESGRSRSALLHRLRLLGIGWGEPRAVSGKSGTFHEVWTLRWRPEFSVALIEANVWGNTVETASSARVRDLAQDADLPRLTSLLDAAILARLPESAVSYLLGRVSDTAASADARRLMDALPPLARVARYGDVRGTGTGQVLPVVDTLFERSLVALPGACTSLDDDAAREMAGSIAGVEECVNLLDRPGMAGRWRAVLRPLAENQSAHALVRGWCCRLLLEAGLLDEAGLQRLAGLALSSAVPAPEAAAWVEGVLRGSGLILLHQTGLWIALDAWLMGLAPEAFTTLLPLVRRAFSDFEPAEKRAMGEKVGKLGSAEDPGAEPAAKENGNLDHRRASRTLPVLARILGVKHDG